MIGQKYTEMKADPIREGAERRLAYTDHLMMAIIDFEDGPKTEPDPPHSHPHEQITYVVSGEILFFMDGEQIHLGPGDTYCVAPDKPHTIQLLTQKVRLVDCFTPLRQDFLK